VQVYRFEQEVPEQVIGSLPVPGLLVATVTGEVEADVVHRNTRTVLVEPVSGVVVSEEENPVTELRGPDGRAGAVLLAGTFGWSESSVDDALSRAEDVRDDRGDLRTAVRWAAAGTGAALLALGALLAARRPTPSDDARDEPVRVPVPSA
jgi:hypothetical protein